MAQKCKKCDPHEICEECPEWIFTLADLIMCMMGLFVILWVLKPPPTPKPRDAPPDDLAKVIIAIREAFGYIPDPTSNDPLDRVILERIKRGPSDGPVNNGKVEEKIEGAEGSDQEVTSVRLSPQAIVGGRMEFLRGSAELRPDNRRMLDQIAQTITGHRNIVLVKGHTSLDDFEGDATAEQKMALSLRRAQVVQDYLVNKGVSPEIIRVQGCSTFEPVVQRVYKPESQAANRRVEVEVTSTLVEDLQDRQRVKPGQRLDDEVPAEPKRKR